MRNVFARSQVTNSRAPMTLIGISATATRGVSVTNPQVGQGIIQSMTTVKRKQTARPETVRIPPSNYRELLRVYASAMKVKEVLLNSLEDVDTEADRARAQLARELLDLLPETVDAYDSNDDVVVVEASGKD